MSESGEENEDNVNGQADSNAADDDEFGFYLQFTKPLVLDLAEPEDKAIAAAWVRKLEGASDSAEEKQLRINYLKLLLFVLQRGRLGGIFRKQPPSGPLQSFPAGFNVFDMGNLILDQEELQPSGAGDGRAVNYNIEISSDLREFVASQEIPNFGIQMYYAWSSDEPINKWSMFDEEKFPQYVLDKIKLLKELQYDEKTGSITKNDSQGKKTLCDLPVLEKCPKKKVKSPQEIEKSQGRSFHTYLGLVGRMGNFSEKCDGDPERFQRQQQQGRANCSRRIPQGQGQYPGQGQGPHPGQGQGQRRCPNQEYEDDQEENGFRNFIPGVSDLMNAQSRPCLCPYPCHHPECPEHRGARGGPQQFTVSSNRHSATNASVRQGGENFSFGAPSFQVATQGQMRASDVESITPRMAPAGVTQRQSYSHRRNASPLPRNMCPSRTSIEPPPQDLYARQNFNQAPAGSNHYCTCPCPRLPQQPIIGPSGSAVGGMGCTGGMGNVNLMRGMGGGMEYAAGMGGMGGGMEYAAGMGGQTSMGGGRPCPEGVQLPGRSSAQQKSRQNKGTFPVSRRPTANFRLPSNAYDFGSDATPQATPPGSRPGATNRIPRQDVIHCYDSQQWDPSLTQTLKKNTPECYGISPDDFPVVAEDNANNSRAYLEAESPDDLTKKRQRTAIIAAARENRTILPSKKSLFDARAQKSQFPQTCPSPAANKRQQTASVCPGMEGRAYTNSSPEGAMSSSRSTSMEPLSQSSPSRQDAYAPHVVMPSCPPNSPTVQKNYGQDGQPYPMAAAKNVGPGRPGPSKAANLNRPHQFAETSKGAIFATDNESGRLCNIANVLQGIRQLTENYRQCEEEQQGTSRPEHLDRADSSPELDCDRTLYMRPPPPPDVYYSPQIRRKDFLDSTCPERDFTSLPDRMSGMGVFHPQRLPMQAQPLPDTPPDCFYGDKYSEDESSFQVVEDPSWDNQQHMIDEASESDLTCSDQAISRSSVASEKLSDKETDNVHFERLSGSQQCITERREYHHTTSTERTDSQHPVTVVKCKRSEHFQCSTPSMKSYHTISVEESTIANYISTPFSVQEVTDMQTADFPSSNPCELVEIFGGNNRNDYWTSPNADFHHFSDR